MAWRRLAIGGLVLLAAAIWTGLVFWRGDSTPLGIKNVVLGWLLLAFATADLMQRRLPNRLLAFALPLVMLSSLIFASPPLLSALPGGAAGYGLFWLLARVRPGALGQGDVKLAGLIGLMVGFPQVLIALPAGMIVGGGAALILLISGRGHLHGAMAYAPYLAFGAGLTLLFA